MWGWLPWVLFFVFVQGGLPKAGVFAGLLAALYPTVTAAVHGLSVKLPDWMTLGVFHSRRGVGSRGRFRAPRSSGSIAWS